eukprot:4660035-Lingulodinium_polyedra.AAC.1
MRTDTGSEWLLLAFVSPSRGTGLLGRAEAVPRLVPAHCLSTCVARLLDSAPRAPWCRSPCLPR